MGALARGGLLVLLLVLPAVAAGAEGAGAASWLRAHVAAAAPILERWGYLAVFVAVAVEGFGIPAPGQTLLMAGALAAAGGALHIGLLLAVALAATLMGSAIGFALGRWGGRLLFLRLRVAESRLRDLERRFERWGALVVVVGRFVDGLRQLNAPLAGALAMPPWTFALANVAGALLWVGVWGFGTWLIEEDMGRIVRLARTLQPWLLVAVGLGVALAAVHLVRRRA
jgi:membrane protein DedA with SNARE-associated domain